MSNNNSSAGHRTLTASALAAQREVAVTTRTFIAVELGEQARTVLTATIRDLAEALPGVRFVDPASMRLAVASGV